MYLFFYFILYAKTLNGDLQDKADTTNPTLRWYLGDRNTSTADYLELRNSGSGSTYGASFVYHDTSANSNEYYGVIDYQGNFQLAKSDHTHSNYAPTSHASSGTTYGVGTTSNYGHCKVINNLTESSFTNGEALAAYQGKLLNDKINNLTNEIDDECAKGGHLNNPSSSKYKALNIYWSGVNYGSNMFLCNIGHIFLVNAPQATSSFKTCTYTKLVNSYNSSYVCDVQSCQVIQQSSTQWRLKFVFQQNTINFSPIVMSLTPGITIDRIETTQS